MDCAYCFYKDRVLDSSGGRQRMSDEVLEKLICDYMGLRFGVVGFAWQGGEPTLMGMDFFARAVSLQKKYGRAGQQISNKMQTNGVLLDEKWCRFLYENKFLLGISIDGPKEFHDEHRLDHSGAGTFDRVMRGIENCRKHGVEFSSLIVLNSRNVEYPERLFEFVVENDLGFVQFIPCIETDSGTGKPANFSITPKQYGDFLCRLFDLWREYGPEKINVRDFDSLVTYYVMGNHTMCTYSKRCGGFLVIEHNGDAFCCEFFVEPERRIGNILQTPLEKLATDSRKRAFERSKGKFCGQCLVCNHLDICRGGCVKDRVRLGGAQADGSSYFCEAYKQFFDHSTPGFMQIAAEVESGKLGRRTRSADKIRVHIEK
ncbi:MAG: anaerobic sulfatase maturase [Sedimentisphaerales bacterium]|nr:anaerobic sulfatase maturase [Sedimentisphaerales bacterium]